MTAIAEVQTEDQQAIPPTVEKRLKRGKEAMKKSAPQRRLNYKFWRGESYWFLDQKNILNEQATISFAGGKPPHRVRNKYRFIPMLVGAKVSAATQKVPSYEIVPSKVDPDSEQAATLAQKVALYGYDKWRLRRATVRLVTHALVGGEGFAYPYWDDTVGPYITGDNGKLIGQGEVAVKVLSANEVGWEPGVDFDESRWYFIEQARPLDVVKEMPGFLGTELKADATDSESPTAAPKDNLVLVTEYFERPSLTRPNGRRIVMANKRRILADEDYPCVDHQGEVVDEPLLIRLSYIVEVDDRDRSFVEQLIDFERTIQDCYNKLVEWKNRCLNPQMTAPRGSNMARRDDTPGAVWQYTPIGGLKPEWERPPQIPRELFEIITQQLEHMRAVAADVDVQPDPRLTSSTAQAAIEQAQLRWQSFLGDLAEAHSRIMRRCLYLVQRHYTEARDIKIQGMFGPDLEQAFRGADLLGQADIRVSPESLAVRSRQSVFQETLLLFQNGLISGEAALAAIRGGIAEDLWQGQALDVGRANYIIQTIKRGPQALFSLPNRPAYQGEQVQPDPVTGQVPDVPGYMPRPFDNAKVQLEVFESWMKTTEWDRLDPGMQHAAIVYYQALQDLQQRNQIKAAIQQQQMAQGLGMANAAKPQGPSELPSQPNLQGPQGANNGQAQ